MASNSLTGAPARPRRGPAERAAAWLYTGPLGHLYAAAADIAGYAFAALGRRLRSRPGRG